MVLSLFSISLLSEPSKSDTGKEPSPEGSDDSSSKKAPRRLEFAEKGETQAEQDATSSSDEVKTIPGNSSGRHLITANINDLT